MNSSYNLTDLSRINKPPKWVAYFGIDASDGLEQDIMVLTVILAYEIREKDR